MRALEAICPKCQTQYSGGALKYRRNLVCLKCGSVLEMKPDADLTSAGISFGRAEEGEIVSEPDSWEDILGKTVLFFISKN